MLSGEWISSVETALDNERMEELKRCPVPTNYSLDGYRGPKDQVQEQLNQAEKASLKTLIQAGQAINDLEYVEIRASGAAGKPMLVVQPEDSTKAQGASFRARDLILLFDKKLRLLTRGRIFQLQSGFRAWLDLDDADPNDLGEGLFIMIRAGSAATYIYNQRLLTAIRRGSSIGCNAEWFLNIMLTDAYKEAQCFPKLTEKIIQSCKFLKSSNKTAKLTSAQKAVVATAWGLSSRELLVVQGPPGCGKTTTISMAVRSYLANPQHAGHRVLFLAPSNIAVDNLLLSFSNSGDSKQSDNLGHFKSQSMLRLGAVSEFQEANNIHKCTLDAIVQNTYKDDLQGLIKDQADAQAAVQREQKKTKQSGSKSDLHQARQQLRATSRDLVQQQKRFNKDVLVVANCVFSTLASAGSQNCLEAARGSQGFDLIVIDEGGQTLDLQLAAGLMLSKGAVIIAGDPRQLPATVLNENNKSNKQFNSVFLQNYINWCDKEYGKPESVENDDEGSENSKDSEDDLVTSLLNVQNRGYLLLDTTFRYGQLINGFPSNAFYSGRVKVAPTAGEPVLESEIFTAPVCYIDTSSSDLHEEEVGENDGGGHLGIRNSGEAQIVVKVIKKLLSQNMKPSDIGVIAPYAAQVSLLREVVSTEMNVENIEISTVDGFQGREKEVIIFSATRSNEDQIVGFLSDMRRLNVAITRAKKLLIFIGDLNTLEGDDGLAKYVEWLYDNADNVVEEDLE